MNKRKVVVLLVLISALMCSCGTADADVDEIIPTATAISETPTPLPPVTTAPTTAPTSAPELPASPTLTEIGFATEMLFDELGNSNEYLLWLGMPMDEMDTFLNKLHSAIVDYGYDDTSGDDTSIRKLECDHFTYVYDDIDRRLTDCYVRTDLFTTKLGLRIGDAAEKSVELYGEDYTEIYTGRVYVREYDMGDFIFRVDIADGVVRSWAMRVDNRHTKTS